MSSNNLANRLKNHTHRAYASYSQALSISKSPYLMLFFTSFNATMTKTYRESRPNIPVILSLNWAKPKNPKNLDPSVDAYFIALWAR